MHLNKPECLPKDNSNIIIFINGNNSLINGFYSRGEKEIWCEDVLYSYNNRLSKFDMEESIDGIDILPDGFFSRDNVYDFVKYTKYEDKDIIGWIYEKDLVSYVVDECK